jgi:hypothetical protein
MPYVPFTYNLAFIKKVVMPILIYNLKSVGGERGKERVKLDPSFLRLINLKKHACKIRIGEFEMSFVIKFQESRTIGVIVLEM